MANRTLAQTLDEYRIDVRELEAFRELAAEVYVVSRTGWEYLTARRNSRNTAALLFWPLMLLLAALPFLRRAR